MKNRNNPIYIHELMINAEVGSKGSSVHASSGGGS